MSYKKTLVFVKQEKRIVRLLWRKGLLKNYKLRDLYWAEFRRIGGGRRRKGKYRISKYVPEVHYSTSDYYGESDEHSLVSSVIEELYWKHADTDNWDSCSGEWPKSSFPNMSRVEFIAWLAALPTVTTSTKINKVLRVSQQ